MRDITNKDMSLISIGRVSPEKNLENIIHALNIFYKKHAWCPRFKWVGRRDDTFITGKRYCEYIDSLLDEYSHVRERWEWLGESTVVAELLQNSDALVLASYHEGLPNVVCEALASGRPALVSNVCDNPLLVRESVRGFLFDPNNPVSISGAIEKFTCLSFDGLEDMSYKSRQYAEDALSVDLMSKNYERLFLSLLD
jgi:glycosyltransferase involved in cell wall biosynthesis